MMFAALAGPLVFQLIWRQQTLGIAAWWSELIREASASTWSCEVALILYREGRPRRPRRTRAGRAVLVKDGAVIVRVGRDLVGFRIDDRRPLTHTGNRFYYAMEPDSLARAVRAWDRR
jgi:hypothetical protein